MTDRPECPECGSIDTVVLNGRVKLCTWCYQQRHQCRGCGQKFLSWWEGSMLRCADTLCLLDGWTKSDGAKAEVALAKKLKIEIIPEYMWKVLS